MKPVLYRYRDTESVIKVMDGYTPGEGWEPLYTKAQVDKAVASERERCAKVCESFGADPWAVSKECADAIRKGE